VTALPALAVVRSKNIASVAAAMSSKAVHRGGRLNRMFFDYRVTSI